MDITGGPINDRHLDCGDCGGGGGVPEQKQTLEITLGALRGPRKLLHYLEALKEGSPDLTYSVEKSYFGNPTFVIKASPASIRKVEQFMKG